MADIKHTAETEDRLEVVGETVSKTDEFIREHKNTIIGVIIAIILIVGGIFAYKSLYLAPRENQALAAMASAERSFATKNYEVALNGDGNNPGFVQIIDDYGSTKAGNLAHFYAGVCNLQLGKYEDAIANLNKFSGNDEIIQARAYCGIGDANAELGKYDEAASYFMKAANYKDNSYSAEYLMKAGLAFEAAGKNDDALKAYNKIKTDYFNTAEAVEIDKYIERLEIKK